MRIPTLVQIYAVGSAMCAVLSALMRHLQDVILPGIKIAAVFIDSAQQTIERVPEGFQHRFLAIPTSRPAIEQAACYPEKHRWVHWLNAPTEFKEPLDGSGFAHEPRNGVLALTANRHCLQRSLANYEREDFANLRSKGIDPQIVRRIRIVAAEPYGATGAAFTVVGPRLLPKSRTRVPLILLSSLLNESLVNGSALEEFRAKLFDIRSVADAADSNRRLLHPNGGGWPYDLEVFFNDSSYPDIQSTAEHREFLERNLEAFLLLLPHFLEQAINVHCVGLERPILQDEG